MTFILTITPPLTQICPQICPQWIFSLKLLNWIRLTLADKQTFQKVNSHLLQTQFGPIHTVFCNTYTVFTEPYDIRIQTHTCTLKTYLSADSTNLVRMCGEGWRFGGLLLSFLWTHAHITDPHLHINAHKLK